jgi:hypothetical protein
MRGDEEGEKIRFGIAKHVIDYDVLNDGVCTLATLCQSFEVRGTACANQASTSGGH